MSSSESHSGEGVSPLRWFRQRSFNEAIENCRASAQNEYTEENGIRLELLGNVDNGSPQETHSIGQPLTLKDVYLAISSVWLGIGEIKYPYRIGMPQASLCFDSNVSEDAKNPAGQLAGGPVGILPVFIKTYAIAVVLELRRGPHNVPLCWVANILCGIPPGPDELQAVENVVTKIIGMAPPEDQPQDLPPGLPPGKTFLTEIWRLPLEMSDDKRNCHAILNVWAYLLDIPIRQFDNSRDSVMTKDFYKSAYELFDLAINGKLDYTAIDQFLRLSGYAYDEEAGVPFQCIKDEKYRKRLRKFRSIRLNSSSPMWNISGEDFETQPVVEYETARMNKKRPREDDSTHRNPAKKPKPSHVSLSSTTSYQTQSLPESDSQASRNTGSEVSQDRRTDDSTTKALEYRRRWREEYERLLRECTEQLNPAAEDPFHDEDNADRLVELDDELVCDLIGSLWHPLYRESKPFAFGSSATFQLHRGPRVEGAVPAIYARDNQPLIMPIILDPLRTSESQQSGSDNGDEGGDGGRKESGVPSHPAAASYDPHTVGHHVLGYATLTRRPQRVHIELYDSHYHYHSITNGSPSPSAPTEAETAARKLARSCGWLSGSRRDPTRNGGAPFPRASAVRDTDVAVVHARCPQQRAAHASCGHYAVAFAWARLLRLEVHGGLRRAGVEETGGEDDGEGEEEEKEELEFLAAAVRVFRLAVHGKMSFALARAFLAAWGVVADAGEPGRLPAEEERFSEAMLRQGKLAGLISAAVSSQVDYDEFMAEEKQRVKEYRAARGGARKGRGRGRRRGKR